MISNSRRHLSVVLLAMVLLVVACGTDDSAGPDVGTDDGATEAPTSETEPSEPEPAEPTEGSPGDADVNVADEDLVAAAQEEGRVLWYTGMSEPYFEPLAEVFEEKYGIGVDVVRAPSGQLVERFATEKEAGSATADIMVFADVAFAETALENGWVMELTDELLPVLEQYPDHAKFPSRADVITFPYVLAYNTDLVDPPPVEWTDVLDEQYRDAIAVADPRASANQAANLNLMMELYGEEFLSDLGALNPSVAAGQVPGLQMVAAGEAKVLLQTTPGGTHDLVDQGAPIAIAIPPEGGYFAHSVALVTDADRPNAARLFAHFMLSREGQEVVNAADGSSALDDIPGSLELPEAYAPYDFEATAENLDRIVELMGLSD